MPITYRIDPLQRTVFTTGIGIVTDADMIAFQVQLRVDPDFDPSFGHLSDLSAVERFAVREETIRYLASVPLFRPDAPRAFVATMPAIYALAGLFQQLSEGVGEHLQVFTDRAAALAWLERSSEQPEQNERGAPA